MGDIGYTNTREDQTGVKACYDDGADVRDVDTREASLEELFVSYTNGDAADAPTDPETTDTEASEAGGSEPTASRGGDQAEPYPEAEATDEPADEERAETDDGVILDEEGGDGRDRGAWPDVDESDEDRGEPAPWPDHGGDDEGFSAEVGEAGAGDVEYVEAATQTASEAGRGAETGRGDETEREAGTGSTVGEGTDITRGDSPDIEAATSQVATEYYCPECEMTRAADGNSMRAGDICPECKRGYVTERPT